MTGVQTCALPICVGSSGALSVTRPFSIASRAAAMTKALVLNPSFLANWAMAVLVASSVRIVNCVLLIYIIIAQILYNCNTFVIQKLSNLRQLTQYLIHQPVSYRFLRTHPIVALHVGFDLRELLAGVFGHDFGSISFNSSVSFRSISMSVTLPRVPEDG